MLIRIYNNSIKPINYKTEEVANKPSVNFNSFCHI